jgi:hypothetical protein
MTNTFTILHTIAHMLQHMEDYARCRIFGRTIFLLNCIHGTWFLEFEIELGYQGEKLIHYVVIKYLLNQTCTNQLQSFQVPKFG